MTKIFRIACLIILCCYGALASAQMLQPTQEQIQQFQSLSPQQQRQLAESMGIDIDALLSQQQSLSGQASSGGTGMQQGLDPSAQQPPMGMDLPIPLKEYEKLLEDYRTLTREQFNILYEGKFSDLPRDEFLSLYEQVTGSEFEERDELRPFGYELFRLPIDTFMPPQDSPVPADYVMGPGDTLVIQLYGKENSTHDLTVSRDGQIQFPKIGPINVAGLTFSQVQKLISETVNEQMIGVRSSITMGDLRTIRVFVLGEAVKPGSYTVSSLSNMTNALLASGGITNVGSLRKIQLKRRGEVVTTLDVYDLLLEGDTSKDARLLPGDAIFIPPVGATVAIQGEVKRPAVYELKDEKAPIADVLALAGGPTAQAHVELTRVERPNNQGQKSLLTLDLTKPADRAFRVRNADSIEIASVLTDLEDAITLKGHVKRPGTYAWSEGLRFSDLVQNVDALKSNPDLDAALIKREVRRTKQTEIRLFSPKAAWANPGGAGDPLLQERDTIFIFDYESDRTEELKDILQDLQIQSRYQDREKIVSIAGSVRFPGEYPLAEGMTIEELISLAGGLTESALGTDAELTRYSIDEDRRRVVTHVPVNLQEGEQYLLPGDSVRIKQIPLWQEKETVEITGEVLFPGTYSIRPGETLNQVLERAGGLTRHAYPKGAIFSRAELRQLEEDRLTDLKEQLEADIAAASLREDAAALTESDAQRLLSNLDSVEAVGRMVIDLPKILESPTSHDFQLEDGDTLEIPRYKPSVTVVGEVQYPTSHFFDRALDVQDYISRSGGTKEQADGERIYVVKANGQVILPKKSAWFRRDASNIEPGDTIIVPIDTDRVDPITLWSSVTQIMYQAALGIAAISSL